MNCEVLFIRILKSRKIFWKLFFWLDYIVKVVITLLYLLNKKPETVIAVSPPSICPVFLFFYSKVFSTNFIIDAHNGAFLNPWISIPLYKKAMESSKVALVHNDELCNDLKDKYSRIKFFSLPDPLVDFNYEANINPSQDVYFLVIITFAPDDPVIELFEGIKKYLNNFDTEIKFYITGDYSHNKKLFNAYSSVEGITFLGFIPNDEYEKLLLNAYGVMTFSTRKMVQQCAVVEAISAEVPIISSDNGTNRRIFKGGGAILTDNNRRNIYESLIKFRSVQNKLLNEISLTKENWKSEWEKRYFDLVKQIRTK